MNLKNPCSNFCTYQEGCVFNRTVKCLKKDFDGQGVEYSLVLCSLPDQNEYGIYPPGELYSLILKDKKGGYQRICCISSSKDEATRLMERFAENKVLPFDSVTAYEELVFGK